MDMGGPMLGSPVALGPARAQSVGWSADGTQIAYIREGRIEAVEVVGGAPRPTATVPATPLDPGFSIVAARWVGNTLLYYTSREPVTEHDQGERTLAGWHEDLRGERARRPHRHLGLPLVQRLRHHPRLLGDQLLWPRHRDARADGGVPEAGGNQMSGNYFLAAS